MADRILPGDLVRFHFCGPEAPAPDVLVVERVPKERVHEHDVFASPEDKERMRQLRERLKLTQTHRLYLVVMASAVRSMLLSSDAKTFIVAFNKDIYKLVD